MPPAGATDRRHGTAVAFGASVTSCQGFRFGGRFTQRSASVQGGLYAVIPSGDYEFVSWCFGINHDSAMTVGPTFGGAIYPAVRETQTC